MPRKKRVKQAQKLSIYRKVHTVAGLVSAIFLLSLSVTGILLNHPSWLECDKDTQPIYEQNVIATAIDTQQPSTHFRATKTGLYKLNQDNAVLQMIPLRYPAKNLEKIYISPQDYLYLIFKHGLVLRAKNKSPYLFTRVAMPDNSYVISDFSAQENNLIVQSELGLFSSSNLGKSWQILKEEKVGMKTWVKRIHTGYFPGLKRGETWLAFGNDVGAFLLIVLIISGIIIYIRTLIRDGFFKSIHFFKRKKIKKNTK